MVIDRRSWLAGLASTAALLSARACGFASAADVAAPALNQLGFLPSAPKRFCMVDRPGSPIFRVVDAAGSVAFEGKLDNALDLTRSCGAHVRAGSFSALKRPGSYRILADGQTSDAFVIGANVYASLLHDAARAFFLIRANAALDDPVTGLRHATSHMTEATLEVNGATRDLTGGWYNAGDYGKWTHMAAISASQMMWLHELRPHGVDRLNLAAPQSDKGTPDLLEQARWGLEWLLKMQNPDGGVLHKVDSEPLFAWGLPPERDMHPRRARGPGSADTGAFVGVMLQAARVFAPFDKRFAARCRAAAERGWAWLERNPSVLTHDPYYVDADPRQEQLWALAEMAAATRDASIEARIAAAVAAVGVIPFMWPTPQILGLMRLARSASSAAPVAKDAIVRAGEALAARSESDAYGYSPDPQHYVWGSNELQLNSAVCCLFAAELGGGDRPRAAAHRMLDYVLGCNALNTSFVTGHGRRAVTHPYHWAMRVYGKPLPGWTSGGANGFTAGADPLLAAVIARGTPPARCFVDACADNGSWASNEGQTSENAALVLATGLISLSS